MTNKKSLFRVGTPRVTETTSRFGCGRDTGGLGTGVYAYRDKIVAKQHINDLKVKQPLIKIDISDMCKNPLIIKPDLFGGNILTRRVNDAGISMRCNNIKDAAEKLTWIPEIVEAVSKKTFCGDEYSPKCRDTLESLIGLAIKKERDCSKNSKGKETWGSIKCSQPMNHLLNDLGFDCVIPDSKAGGNDNHYGSVILKESIDRKLGRKTIENEDINDLGVIIK